MFRVSGSMLEISPQKQVTDVSLFLKSSDTESENLSSLIRLSLYQLARKRCIIYRYIIIAFISATGVKRQIGFTLTTLISQGYKLFKLKFISLYEIKIVLFQQRFQSKATESNIGYD